MGKIADFINKVYWGPTAIVIFFILIMGGTLFSFYADKKDDKIYSLEKKIKEDSTKIASLEAGIKNATGNAIIHDTVIITEKVYVGDNDALMDIHKRLDEMEEFRYKDY